MTNGGESFPYKQQFLKRQAEWERAQSLNPILEEFMKGKHMKFIQNTHQKFKILNLCNYHLLTFIGKDLFICDTAYNDLMKIVNTVGGEKERERTRNLMKRVSNKKNNFNFINGFFNYVCVCV